MLDVVQIGMDRGFEVTFGAGRGLSATVEVVERRVIRIWLTGAAHEYVLSPGYVLSSLRGLIRYADFEGWFIGTRLGRFCGGLRWGLPWWRVPWPSRA